MRIHQMLPAQATIPAQAIEPWAKMVEEQSGGRIKFELYPAMQLGGAPPALFDQAKDGVVDIIWTVLGYTPGRFPKSEVFEMPFLVTTGEATSVAFQKYVEANAMDEFDGVHLIAVHTHGPGLFHTQNPVTKLEDLAGMKIRGGSRVISDMLGPARRRTDRHAGAAGDRGTVQGRDQWHDHSVGSDAVAEGG